MRRLLTGTAVALCTLTLSFVGASPASARNASSDAAVTAANPYISDVGAPENVTDFLPAPNLTVRDNLLAFWYMRIYDTVPYPQRDYLRAARYLESRYWLWGKARGADIVAKRYFRQKIVRYDRAGGRHVIAIRPPVRGTIGPVRYVYPYGWSPGFGQRDPAWWDTDLSDGYDPQDTTRGER